MKIYYNAIFEYATDGINVTFPDVSEAITCAYTKDEAVNMAQSVLDLVLHKRKVSELPKPTEKEKISIESNMEVVSVSIVVNEKDGIIFGKDVKDLV